jgi:YVTN family beta-propeller protein
MSQSKNLRLAFILVLLAALGVREVWFERRFSWLRPGARMYAYVANTADGTLTVLDLVRLAPIATIPVGPAPSGVRTHPTRDEIWGVSSDGGYVWVVSGSTGQMLARIPVGAMPYALDFSANGRFAYVAASGSAANAVLMLDCATRQVVARGRAGRRPWLARLAPDGKTIVVPNHDDATVSLLDAASLTTLAVVPVGPQPEHVVVLPDSSKAFISSSTSRQVSVVNLRTRALVTNLNLGGTPGDLILKPDGGELYVPSPDAHGLVIVNTNSNEVAEYLLLGLAPLSGVLDAAGNSLFVSDSAGGRVVPVQIATRQVQRPIPVGEGPDAAQITPGGEMLLVVNTQSNDVSVIRTRANPTPSLITLIPVGRRPRDLAVKFF